MANVLPVTQVVLRVSLFFQPVLAIRVMPCRQALVASSALITPLDGSVGSLKVLVDVLCVNYTIGWMKALYLATV